MTKKTYSKNFAVTLWFSETGRALVQFRNTAQPADIHSLDIEGNQLPEPAAGEVRLRLGEFKFNYSSPADASRNQRLVSEILAIARREVRRLQASGEIEHPAKRLEPKFFPKRELEGHYKPPLDSGGWQEVYTKRCRPSLEREQGLPTPKR